MNKKRRIGYQEYQLTHVLQLALLVICVEFKDIEHGLWIFRVVFARDGRLGEKFAPLLWHALLKCG